MLFRHQRSSITHILESDIMKNTTLYKMLVRSSLALFLVSFSFGLNTHSSHAANELSPVLAVHKSKLLSSNFLPNRNHSTQAGGSVFMKSSIERRFDSSNLLSSRLVERTHSASKSSSAYRGKVHTAKPHRKL